MPSIRLTSILYSSLMVMVAKLECINFLCLLQVLYTASLVITNSTVHLHSRSTSRHLKKRKRGRNERVEAKPRSRARIIKDIFSAIHLQFGKSSSPNVNADIGMHKLHKSALRPWCMLLEATKTYWGSARKRPPEP